MRGGPGDMRDLYQFIQHSGAALIVLQLVLLWRTRPTPPIARFYLPLGVGLIFQLLSGTPFESLWSPAFDIPVELIRVHVPIFVWWFAAAMFDDEYKPGRWELGVAAIWLALQIGDLATPNQGSRADFAVEVCINILRVGISVDLAFKLWAGLKTDLVERRRRARFLVGAGVVAINALSLVADVGFGDDWFPVWYAALFYGGMFALIFAGSLWMLTIDEAALRFEPPAEAKAPTAPDLAPAERLLKTKLDAAIEEKIYLDPELSIGKLAAALDAPEHQVRALINRALGHRNFRAFLNENRLATAKAALADPEKAATPILTIAMESGFNSLAPFNRAFKEATGDTPSAWRARALRSDQ